MRECIPLTPLYAHVCGSYGCVTVLNHRNRPYLVAGPPPQGPRPPRSDCPTSYFGNGMKKTLRMKHLFAGAKKSKRTVWLPKPILLSEPLNPAPDLST